MTSSSHHPPSDDDPFAAEKLAANIALLKLISSNIFERSRHQAIDFPQVPGQKTGPPSCKTNDRKRLFLL
jgi:hypothetical protein